MITLAPTSRHARPVVLPNYVYGFASWYSRTMGFPLPGRYRHMIGELERLRLAATGCGRLAIGAASRVDMGMRVIIEDSDSDNSGIADMLSFYIFWLSTRVLTNRRPLISDITASAAKRHFQQLDTTVPAMLKADFSKQAAFASGRRPNLMRGQSCDIALMLNCHAYPRKGPFASRGHDFYLYGVDYFNDSLRVILPMLPTHPESILIIHGKPNRRVTGFQSLRLRARAATTPYTLLAPASCHVPIIKRLISPISPISPICPISPIGPIPLKPLKPLPPLKTLLSSKKSHKRELSPPPKAKKTARAL